MPKNEKLNALASAFSQMAQPDFNPWTIRARESLENLTRVSFILDSKAKSDLYDNVVDSFLKNLHQAIDDSEKTGKQDSLLCLMAFEMAYYAGLVIKLSEKIESDRT